jgi:hypothetical protein
MIGNNISVADLFDTVKLMVFRDDLLNKNIDYIVYKKKDCTYNGNIWDYITECLNIFKGDSKVATLSGIGFTTWKSNLTGDYYFSAKVIDSSEVIGSDILHVKTTVANAIPTTKIIKPIENSTFIIRRDNSKTNPISFKQISLDADDDLNAIWRFGDENTTSINNCLTTGNCNTSHIYNSSGTKVINLDVKEATRGQSTYDLARIYIYKDGLNLFVIIDSPNYKQRIVEAGPVYLNATSTYVANCTPIESECKLAGKGNGNCYKVTDVIDPGLTTWCYRYAESSNLLNPFKFRWTFDQGTVDQEIINTNPTPFEKIFLKAKNHPINLRVNYTVVE